MWDRGFPTSPSSFLMRSSYFALAHIVSNGDTRIIHFFQPPQAPSLWIENKRQKIHIKQSFLILCFPGTCFNLGSHLNFVPSLKVVKNVADFSFHVFHWCKLSKISPKSQIKMSCGLDFVGLHDKAH